MKSKQRKTGGAYRRMKRAISLHAKPGKDRKKQTAGAKIEAVVKERAIKEHNNEKHTGRFEQLSV
ncbi:MAG: hypothetical protein IKK99_01175 [Oscillospiraceae bacterium]|nr:hypothetical protein [Oscillospiraceae bacterium]